MLMPCVGNIAAPASLTSLTGVAAPCHRAGRGHLQFCHKASSTSGPVVSYVRCGAMPSRRVWSHVVLPSASPAAPASPTFPTSDAAPCLGAGSGHLRHCHLRVRKGPAAPVSLTSLTSDAEPCHRPGCECSRCCHQRVREGQQQQRALRRLPAMQCRAIASGGVTYRAAVRPAAPAGLMPLMCDAVLCRRAGCGHLQCCRQRVQKGASGASTPCISYERGGAMPWCRR